MDVSADSSEDESSDSSGPMEETSERADPPETRDVTVEPTVGIRIEATIYGDCVVVPTQQTNMDR